MRASSINFPSALLHMSSSAECTQFFVAAYGFESWMTDVGFVVGPLNRVNTEAAALHIDYACVLIIFTHPIDVKLF